MYTLYNYTVCQIREISSIENTFSLNSETIFNKIKCKTFMISNTVSCFYEFVCSIKVTFLQKKKKSPDLTRINTI